MESWLRIKSFTEKNRDLLLEVVRVYLGIGLFAKGVFFARHTGVLIAMLPAGRIDVPGVVVAHVVALVHLTGGLLLALGLLTRLAAWLQVPVVLGAVFFVHLREDVFGPSSNLEFALLVLVLLVLFGVSGGGRWSADQAMARRTRQVSGGGPRFSGTA